MHLHPSTLLPTHVQATPEEGGGRREEEEKEEGGGGEGGSVGVGGEQIGATFPLKIENHPKICGNVCHPQSGDPEISTFAM